MWVLMCMLWQRDSMGRPAGKGPKPPEAGAEEADDAVIEKRIAFEVTKSRARNGNSQRRVRRVLRAGKRVDTINVPSRVLVAQHDYPTESGC
jgi:hypothetical protein